MRIHSFHYKRVFVPVRYNVVSNVRHSTQIPLITLEIQTDEGIKGIGYCQAFNKFGANSICAILEAFEEWLIGSDPIATEIRWQEMWNKTKLLGHSGIVAFAISLVDIALWDIKGKHLNKPVYRLLGGEKKVFQAYASDGLWLVNENDAIKHAELFIEEGFNTIKMRMGRDDKKKDIKVLEALRKKWDEDIAIMVDANQSWNRYEAEEMLNQLLPYNIYWLEEPIDATDIEGYFRLQQNSRISLCFGENIFGIQTSYNFLPKKSTAYYTPDLQRIGGITGWMKLKPFLEFHRVQSTLHLFPEISVHLLSTYPFSEKIEWMSWSSALFKDPLECKNGEIEINDEPGFGLEFK